MQVPYEEGLANHLGSESCASVGNGVGEALTGGCAGGGREPRNTSGTPRCRRGPNARKAIRGTPQGRGVPRPGGVEAPRHAQTHLAREAGEPVSACSQRRPPWEASGRKPRLHGHRPSDGGIVPQKSPNTPRPQGVEGMEGRPPVKGNAPQHPLPWTQSQEDGRPAARERIRQAVRRRRKDRLTSLYHHSYHVAHLREAYFALQRQAAPGVDGATWQHYGQDLEANLQDLSKRLARGAYRATAVRRAYIPKPDGRQRPLGVPALEDKIVQCVTAWIFAVIWEEEFRGVVRIPTRAGSPSRPRCTDGRHPSETRDLDSRRGHPGLFRPCVARLAGPV
jgi:RNA-directed DNA polymerase